VLPKSEYGQEILGVSQVTGIDLYKIVFANFFYEFDAACTSFVVQDPKTNEILHGRNLDFPIPNLEKVVVTMNYYKEGTLV